MRNIVLFGKPGAGKGTQSDKIIEKYKLVHLSTGDLFRKHLKEGTELGTLAKKYMDEGHLVPDEVVIGMVKDKILSEKENGAGFIFDGFPRNNAQAAVLDKMLEENGLHISGMIALDVDDAEAVKRVLERGKVSGRADDQDEEIVKNRIKVYNEETLPVAEYYKAQNKYTMINGVGSIDSIFENICTWIEGLN